MPTLSTQMQEEAVAFANAGGQQLIGVWHAAGAQGSPHNPTIVMLHGWSGTRTGPHQMLTRAARAFACEGFCVLRFDFAGRGDSEGDTENATLATMADDTRAAIEWCSREKGASHIVLLGLCSGCEVALAASTESGICGMALWSAPVFAAAESGERKARKRSHNLKQYARKFLRPATYAKLLTGRLDTKTIRQAVAGGGGAAGKNVEADAAGQLPPGWRAAAMKRFEKFAAPLLLVYGTGDPTTEEALRWHRVQVGGRLVPEVHLVEGANHSYYGLAWEREVLEVTRDWLRQLTSAS